MYSDRIKLQLDGNKLLHHLDVVDKWIEGKEIYPIYIAFSPSSLCNHKCVFCVYQHKTFEPVYFPLEKYKALVDEWKILGVKSIFFAGDGDPLLNKKCVEMVHYTKSNGLDIAMNTNGRLLNAGKIDVLVESLSWIRFSVNAGTQSTYAKIHNTHENDFECVIKNIADMVERKRKMQSDITIGVQCLLLKETLDEIGTLAHRLKEIGVDYLAVKPFLKHPLIPYSSHIENISEALDQLEGLKALNDENFKFALRENLFRPQQAGSRSYHRCLSGPFMVEIDANGDVYNCGPYLGNKDHCYGNILQQSFKEMWSSPQCQEVMKRIQTKLDVSKCMPFCRPDSVNRFLWEIKNPPQHENFI